VTYVARGVSMFELYVSPDLLSDGEWAAMSAALRWARDRFGLLRRSEMVGGDPRKGEPYGYVHASGARAIVAARNPLIEPQALKVRLDPELGFGAGTGELVLERVYPTRYISPRRITAGAELEIVLDGFEAAVYEIYPLGEAARPLPAGVEFSGRVNDDGSYTALCYGTTAAPGLLNDWPGRATAGPAPLADFGAGIGTARQLSAGRGWVEYEVDVPATTRGPRLAMLLKPDASWAGADLPEVETRIDGHAIVPRLESQEGAWRWVAAELPPGRHRLALRLRSPAGKTWRGAVHAWLLGRVAPPFVEVTWRGGAAAEPPMPPLPWPEGEFRRQLRIGEAAVSIR